jgi:hypothetical protein
MKVGDMIYDFCHDQTGLIIAMPNMALQTYMTVLYEDGDVLDMSVKVDDPTIEVISVTR